MENTLKKLNAKEKVGVNMVVHLPKIDPNEINPAENVISSNDHTQISHTDIFQATNYGGSQCWIVVCAQNHTVW